MSKMKDLVMDVAEMKKNGFDDRLITFLTNDIADEEFINSEIVQETIKELK